ncbi:hydantoinase/oxoprolinase family protein [Pseudonocardia benzenivorans]|uniref:Hydantoinase/oxoprolinase family protein n=1 Tax=Pseudonocardia benzenivorans TaxID=228005 RepID=A0ABW3VL57_9PSEU
MVSRYRIGIDAGGTFTDVMAISETGEVTVTKVASTAEDPSIAFMNGISEIGCNLGDIDALCHGTTVTINAILQRAWRPIGLLTTAGFRDTLEVARQTVPGDWGSIYTWVKPPRVVPLTNVHDIGGRIAPDGSELEPLDEAAVRSAAERMKQEEIQSLAVCFLHSYANSRHEERAREIIEEVHPGCAVTLSAEILPEFREYERAVTTCLNAVLVPLVRDYLRRLTEALRDKGYENPLFVMKSSGGLTRSENVVQQAIAMTYSGPSAGVLGMARLAQRIGEERVLTYDMGGTSTDVALVEGGKPLLATGALVDIYPVQLPMVDLASIGTGGGSIAGLGSATRLHVGPRSAGSNPGPVCYGRGGTEPTVTDANLVLGRVAPALLGGSMRLDVDAARDALGALGAATGMSAVEMAHGILEIALSTMAGAVREVSVKRGRDPRDYVLMAYGGAGPLHAAELASLLGIPRVLVPPHPGLGSCIGLLEADVQETVAHTLVALTDEVDRAFVRQRFAELGKDVRDRVLRQGVSPGHVELQFAADMRYAGMATDLTIDVERADVADEALVQAVADFHREHKRVYGYSYDGEQAVELVNLRATAVGRLERPEPEQRRLGGTDSSVAVVGERTLHLAPGEDGLPCPVYQRALLHPGAVVAGPAVIDDYDSTLFVPRHAVVRTDEFENLVLSFEEDNR